MVWLDLCTIAQCLIGLWVLLLGADILRQTEAHFPLAYVEPATLKHLRLKQMRQFVPPSKPLPFALKKMETVRKKLEAMSELVKKDLAHAKYLQEQKDKKFCEQQIQKSLHSRRLAEARAQKYFRDYEVQLKRQLQQPRTKEEQVFVKAFESGLKLKNEEKRRAQKCADERLHHEISQQLEKLEN